MSISQSSPPKKLNFTGKKKIQGKFFLPFCFSSIMVESKHTGPCYNGHIIVISFPLQGHAAPLIKLSNRIRKFGVKVTFVTTEFIHSKMASSMPGPDETDGNPIRFVSFPDGLESDIDRKDQKKMSSSIYKLMPGQLEGLLNQVNNGSAAADHDGEKFTGVIVDSPLAFLMDIPKKMGIKCSTYWCSTPGCLSLGCNVEKLVEAKVIDPVDGTPLKSDERVQLVQGMPGMRPNEFTWCFPADLDRQREMFHYFKGVVDNMIRKSDFILCNWFHDLDKSGSNLVPNLLPVGPLLADGQSAGSFESEDSSCVTWLDKQAPKSVIYVAFGSTSRFSEEQIKEIASGLELMEKPFLWVAWSGLTNGTSMSFPDGFVDRVAGRGKIVDWAPQERVLAHPSIACFISHCGWGSFMESISMGVPFLCWPYFGDQLYTQTCICEAWKVGLWLNADEKGIISRNEIKKQVDNLFSDEKIRSNAMKLKEMARESISEGGSSYKSLEHFVSQCSNSSTTTTNGASGH
ncbi:OLC1v1012199C1 [Oldenlandia corymbosa var. corymbosa]|uniref:OLC1v1012199C1 n=1 Tax=Oldenlandia corymbosa var. corymbosa TaxID=529605 RepID=A0AAV1DVF8_OLDCO|nr:OLC1v1012199C1 [Oldenlandia corymbosa var. corymbosa]